MKNIRKTLILTIFICLLCVQFVFAQSRIGYGNPLVIYKAPEGFTITSYSKNWGTVSQLKEIRQELLSNFYSKEIKYLKNIYIYPDSPDGVLGYTHYDLGRDKKGNYIYEGNTYIEIFDANSYTDIRDFSRVLAHEYGHHFTTYYLVNGENKFFDQWRNTGYAKVRGITDNKKIKYQDETTFSQRKWDIMEIAAEDYVQLFGSPNAKRNEVYRDIQQRIQLGINNNFNYIPSFNMEPQENLEIPLAADVKGLEQYWLNLAGKVSTHDETLPLKPKIRLVSRKEISKGCYQYRLEWNKIPGNTNYRYTLVGYPDEKYSFPIPVKTISQGEDAYAILGSGLKFDYSTGKEKIIIDEFKGRYVFRLFIQSPSNKIYSSELFKVNFNYPIIIPNGIYKDINTTDWAYGAVKKLYDQNIMVGSPDGYFYPFHNITYLEFITIMNRYLNTSSNWEGSTLESIIINQGQMTLKELNIIKQKQHMTREDVVVILYHYMRLKNLANQTISESLDFQDNSQIMRKKEVSYLTKLGIIQGNNGYFLPGKAISRQELACILGELMKY